MMFPKYEAYIITFVNSFAFASMERRIYMLQSTSARERYEEIIKQNGELLLQVPLQYIASFLGITPQHLSRLRKNN